MPCRLIIVAPHVVQYHAPFYRELARRPELDVRVLYLDDAGVRPTWDPTMSATLEWDVPLLDGYTHEFLPVGSARRGLELSRRLLLDDDDAILIQGHQRPAYWLAWLCARMRRKRVLYRGEAALRDRREGLREATKRALLSFLFRRCDVVFHSCRGGERFFRHYGCPPERLALLPCAVDNAFFRRARAALAGREGEIRAELGVPPEMPMVLNVGRHDGHKRQAELLEAVGRLRRQGIEAALVLVGSGPETEALRHLAAGPDLAGAVHFAGFVNQSQISRYYAVADVFALSSSYDPSPKVLNEALNFELPIVCSDAAGTVGDVVADGANGFVYPSGDTDALALAIGKLLGDADLRRRMGRRSLELAGAWSLEAGADAVVAAIRRLGR